MLPDIKAYNGQENYIFVSYSHKDREKVYPFIAALQDKYNVWFDKGISYESEWEKEIAEKLKNCSLFIYMITEESLKSTNCMDELYHARRLQKNFLNILVEQTELPDWFEFRYGRYQMCRLFTFSSHKAAVEDIENNCEWLSSVTKDSTQTVEPVDMTKHKTEEPVKREPENRSKRVSKGDSITFGKYVQKVNGSPEPIEWLVLDEKDGEALVISKYALDCQPYNESYKKVTWETCTLRKWLNETFFNTAFSREEQNRIITSTVTADKNPDSSTPPGKDTTDKVFLLSIKEADKYFDSYDSRKCTPTDYAIAQGTYTSGNFTVGGKATCWWWLRSPGGSSSSAAYVNYVGSVINYGYLVNNRDDAVRPALRINL